VETILAGVDLAWQSDRNPTAVAIGQLSPAGLLVTSLEPALRGIDAVVNRLAEVQGLAGIAIDGPLIINNVDGQRPCEKLLGRVYGSRYASCHTSNSTRYPDAASVALSEQLMNDGFEHLGKAQWQIECYPHPAIIEIFNLDERLKYKKGRVAEKRSGQRLLANYLMQLENSPVLQLAFADHAREILDAMHIASLRGQALKTNEDVLDSVVCLYIAALYATDVKGKTFGSTESGYIWVPTTKCI
jgi:predicted RNase H-like nuclease